MPIPLTGQEECVRRRPRVRNQKLRKNQYDLKIQRKFGITVNELDIIIAELCKQYKCQWSIIAKELQRQHGIRMANNAVRERYVRFLDPSIRKDWYTVEQEEEMARLFWIQGKSYNQIKDVLGNCGRGSIRQSLQYSARRGFSRLLKYINTVSTDKPVDISTVERVFSVSAICSQGRLDWKSFRYSYAVLFYFMYKQGQELHLIPKDLAILVYERLISRGTKRLKLRQLYYSRINPQRSFTQAIMKRKNKHMQYLKKYKTSSSGYYSNDSMANTQLNDDDDARLQELILPDVEELDVDIEMLRLGEESGLSESFDLKDLAFSSCQENSQPVQESELQQAKQQQQEDNKSYSMLSYKELLSENDPQ